MFNSLSLLSAKDQRHVHAGECGQELKASALYVKLSPAVDLVDIPSSEAALTRLCLTSIRPFVKELTAFQKVQSLKAKENLLELLMPGSPVQKEVHELSESVFIFCNGGLHLQ